MPSLTPAMRRGGRTTAGDRSHLPAKIASDRGPAASGGLCPRSSSCWPVPSTGPGGPPSCYTRKPDGPNLSDARPSRPTGLPPRASRRSAPTSTQGPWPWSDTSRTSVSLRRSFSRATPPSCRWTSRRVGWLTFSWTTTCAVARNRSGGSSARRCCALWQSEGVGLLGTDTLQPHPADHVLHLCSQPAEDLGHASPGVDDREVVAYRQLPELGEQHALVLHEIVVDVRAANEIHPRLPIVEPSATKDPGEELLHVDVEVDHPVGDEGEPVQLLEPSLGHSPDRRPGDQGEDVPVGDDHHACPQPGDDQPLQAIPEVSRIEQVQRDRIECMALLGPLDPGSGQVRATQPRVQDRVPLVLEPFFEQGHLGRAPHAIRGLDHHQATWERLTFDPRRPEAEEAKLCHRKRGVR